MSIIFAICDLLLVLYGYLLAQGGQRVPREPWGANRGLSGQLRDMENYIVFGHTLNISSWGKKLCLADICTKNGERQEYNQY